MSNIAQIRNYIQSIALDENKLDLQSFFTIIHSKFFNDQNISFVTYFLSLIDKGDEFCIADNNLKRYGIITARQTSSHILRCLTDNGLIIDTDFIKRTEIIGNTTTYTYMMTPDAFKTCLIRSNNTRVYGKYYFLLEKVYRYYSEYQRIYDANTITNQSNTITNLIDKQNVIYNHLSDKSYRSVINPVNEYKIHMFMVLKPIDPTDHKTIITRGQRSRIDTILRLTGNTHTVYIEPTYTANPITMLNNAKTAFISYIKNYVKEYNVDGDNEEKIRCRDIPVTFSTTSIYYIPNEYISYESTIAFITNMNDRTQSTPKIIQ